MQQIITRIEEKFRKSNIINRILLSFVLMLLYTINSFIHVVCILFFPPQKSFALLYNQNNNGAWNRSYYSHRKYRHNLRFGSVSFTLLLVTSVLAVNFITTLIVPISKVEIAYAATLIVNDSGNSVDVNPGNGVCETAPGNGICTLRAAVQEAEAVNGPDTITFSVATISATNPFIIAAGNLIIDGGAGVTIDRTGGIPGTGFSITGDNVTISNVEIINSPDFGIDVVAANNINITDVTINPAQDGIRINGGSDTVTVSGALIQNSSNHGFRINDSDNITIVSSTVTGSTLNGINLENSSGTEISSSTISNSNNGIAVNLSDNITISSNNVSDNSNDGIAIGLTDDSTISYNTVNNNGNDGIRLSAASQNNTINNNTATNSGVNGITVIGASDNNAIRANTISGNTNRGIDVGDSNFVAMFENIITQVRPISLTNANENILAPTIDVADASYSSIIISGTAPEQAGKVEFFYADTNEYCEGFIDSKTINDGTFSFEQNVDYTDYDYISVTFTDSDNNTSLISSKLIDKDNVAPTTTASPVGGDYTTSQSVVLTATDTNDIGESKTDILTYYTTDGTTPTTASELYTSAISISETTTLKFFSVDPLNNLEAVNTELYTITTEEADEEETDEADEEGEIIAPEQPAIINPANNYSSYFKPYLVKNNISLFFELESSETTGTAKWFVDDVKQKNIKGNDTTSIGSDGKSSVNIPVKDNSVMTTDCHKIKARVIDEDGVASEKSKAKSFVLGTAHSQNVLFFANKKQDRGPNAINTTTNSNPTLTTNFSDAKDEIASVQVFIKKIGTSGQFVYEGLAIETGQNGDIKNYKRKIYVALEPGAFYVYFKALNAEGEEISRTDEYGAIYYKGCPVTLSDISTTSNLKVVIPFYICSDYNYEIYIDGQLNGSGSATDVSGTAFETYTSFLPLGLGSHNAIIRSFRNQGEAYRDVSFTFSVAYPTSSTTSPSPTPASEQTTPQVDTDQDTIPDIEDEDNDGLTDQQEDELGTDSTTSDTDSDGVDDATEVEQGTDPTDANDQGQKDTADIIDEIADLVKDDYNKGNKKPPTNLPGLTTKTVELTDEQKQELTEDLNKQTSQTAYEVTINDQPAVLEVLPTGETKIVKVNQFDIVSLIKRMLGYKDVIINENEIIFQGKIADLPVADLAGLPTFAIMYVYSDPIVQVAQVNDNGEWRITVPLDLLSTGQHTAFAQTEINGVKSDQVELVKFVVEEENKLSRTTWLVIINIIIAIVLILIAIVIQAIRNKRLNN